jgi:signal transduction histidine kinase
MRNLRLTRIFSQHITFLNVSQVAFDLLFFFVIIMITGGGVESIAHAFYFIPIVVSMILFGYRGAILVAICSGMFIFLSVFIQYGFILPTLRFVDFGEPTYTFQLALTKAGVLFLIYLLTGFFGAYISKIVRSRDALLLEKIKEEEEHVHQLEELTGEFEKSAKLLVRRDLDLSLANQQLQKLDQMKSEIISVAAHQLRTPLSAIKWTLKMIMDEDVGSVTNEQKSLLGKGYESNERMINLVNDMLSVDRLESGRIKYNFVSIQFETLVEAMVQELLPLAAKKGMKIVLSRPNALLPKIKLDPDKMHDVLQNLIDNAIKYGNQDSAIDVRINSDQKNIIFSVHDNGIGIPNEQFDKIFSRFFRATNAIRNVTDGSGLGLYIAQSVIKRHGGEIWFTSKEGEGTTFLFSLPLSS